ncbi:MAG: YdcF family protein [Alphaproteobacteria bacterium]|nr:YdcF family protein [Alphaproteobacteria bacterium]
MFKSFTIYTCLVALTLWVLGFLAFAFYLFTLSYKAPTQADVIVVWTGGAERVATAVELLEKQYAPHLFISGVNAGVSAESVLKGVPAALRQKIDLGRNAENTQKNAEETAEWVKAKKILFVTSLYHMPRSLLELKQQVKDATIFPYAVSPKRVDTAWIHTANASQIFIEYNKFLAAGLRIYIKELLSCVF